MPFVGSIGPLELLVVLGIILLIFGPKRLPGAGRALGQGIREFKDSITSKRGRGDDDEPAELPAGPSRAARPEGADAAPGSSGAESAGPGSPGAESAAPGSPGAESVAPGSPEGERVARE